MDMPQVDESSIVVRSAVRPSRGTLIDGRPYTHSSHTDIRNTFAEHGFKPPSGQTAEVELKALRAFARGIIEGRVLVADQYCVPEETFNLLLESIDGISLVEEFPTAERQEPTGL